MQKIQIPEITIPEGKRAEWINNVLTLVDEPKTDNRPVTERVKTFEDACIALGEEHTFVEEWRYSKRDYSKDLVAYLKLRIIAAALNEGWKPKFSSYEHRWHPFFKLWKGEELEDKTEEWKKEHSLWWCGSCSIDGSDRGLAVAYSGVAWSNLWTAASSHLVVKSEGLAVYFGKQFIDIWTDYVILDNHFQDEDGLNSEDWV